MLNDETHRIGQVAAVESERISVELDVSASGLVKAGTFGVLPIGAVNSYVTVSAGASRVVAVVTAVRMIPTIGDVRSNADPADGIARTLDATMVGRIQGGSFRPGVATFPSVFSPVSVATREDLDAIFRPTGEALLFGDASVSPDQDVWLDAEKLLTRHSAILGSTGSGKSCSVMAVVDGLIELGVGHMNTIIFDANGEYASAFEDGTSRASAVTSFALGPDLGATGLTVPLWFMNAEEHIETLRAADGVQSPMLQRALADARLTGLESGDALLGLRVVRRTVDQVMEIDRAEKNKAQEKAHGQLQGLRLCLEGLVEDVAELQDHWSSMLDDLSAMDEINLDPGSWDPIAPADSLKLQQLCLALKSRVRDAVADLGMGSHVASTDFDAPAFYSFEDLTDFFLPQRIDLESMGDPRIGQFMASLQMRMSRLLADDRYAFMTRVEPFDSALGRFLRLLFGKEPVGESEEQSPWRERYRSSDTTDGSGHAVTIIDLSYVAADVLSMVTALIARLVLELVQRLEPRGSMPVLLVLEEAHRYVTSPTGAGRTQSSIIFERIAKEGRKFGVSLCLATQRPSELDPTVLSQCGTVIAHRISNQVDQDIIRSATPMVSRDVLRQLPGLATQHAIVLGEATPVPVTVRVRPVADPPNSRDPSFLQRWRDADPTIDGATITRLAEEWELGRRQGPDPEAE